MSNTTLGVGPGAVDSLALVAVDGVTIIGDGANVPLSAISGPLAAANVTVAFDGTVAVQSQTGFSSIVASGSTGSVLCQLANPPADTHIVPIATGKAVGATANVTNNGSGLLDVHTTTSGSPGNTSFTIAVFAVP